MEFRSSQVMSEGNLVRKMGCSSMHKDQMINECDNKNIQTKNK